MICPFNEFTEIKVTELLSFGNHTRKEVINILDSLGGEDFGTIVLLVLIAIEKIKRGDKIR